MIPHQHPNTDGTSTWDTPEHLRRHLSLVHARPTDQLAWDELPGAHWLLHAAAELAPRTTEHSAT